ncbi:MAG: tetratricopeptide repeat protein, partial [Nitrospiraceae bacterium]
MNKLFALVLGVLLLLFLGITLLKNRSPGDDILDVTRVAAPAERARIQRFWELYRQATGHRIAGRTRQAVETYAGALELNTEHEDALYYLGNVYFDLGEFADAETAWKRLVDVNPTSARAHSQLGNLYLCFDYEELVDLEAAEAEFQRALDIYKEDTGPLLRLGEIALIRGDVAQARYY